MADESVDAWLATQHDERDRYTKAVHERAERRKADRVRDEAYRLAFARVWDIPKPLDDEALRQWDERFAELGKILAGHEGLANRLHSANLDGQNVALAGAVKLLQEATKGQTIAAHLRTFSLTPELQRFNEWLPFVCDDLCPPPPVETTLISTYSEPPGGYSRDDYEAADWLFNKRPVDNPEPVDDGRTQRDEPAPTSPHAPKVEGTPVDDGGLAKYQDPLTPLGKRILKVLWNHQFAVQFDTLRDEAWEGDTVSDSGIERRLQDIEKRWTEAGLHDIDLEISPAATSVKLVKPIPKTGDKKGDN